MLYCSDIIARSSHHRHTDLVGSHESLALKLAQQAVVQGILQGRDMSGMRLVVGTLVAVDRLRHTLVVHMEG